MKYLEFKNEFDRILKNIDELMDIVTCGTRYSFDSVKAFEEDRILVAVNGFVEKELEQIELFILPEVVTVYSQEKMEEYAEELKEEFKKMI